MPSAAFDFALPMNKHLKSLILSTLLSLFSVVDAYDIAGFTPDQVIAYKQTVNSTDQNGAVLRKNRIARRQGKPSF